MTYTNYPHSIGKPNLADAFVIDLIELFNLLKQDYSSITENLIEEVVIGYACEMEKHFKKEMNDILPEDWMKHIATETINAASRLYPISRQCKERCFREICQSMKY